MNEKIIILSCIILSGCATSTTAYLPDGDIGHTIDCSGAVMTWGDCQLEAGELCKEKGYTVISKDGDVDSSITSNEYGTYGSSENNRSMLIKCGN